MMIAARQPRREGSSGTPVLGSMPRPAAIPLSSAQRRMWTVDRMQGGSPEYNQPVALRLRGPLKATALRRALDTVIARHETLRTRFVGADEAPVQVVDPPFAVPVSVSSLRELDPAGQQEAAIAALNREWDIPFDLAAEPPVRVRLLEFADDDHVFIRTIHHIASDRWSHGIFNRELSRAYESATAARRDDTPPLPVQYADYALWEPLWLDEERLDTGLDFWTRHLDDIRESPLPADRPAAKPPRSSRSGVYRHTLPTALLAMIADVGRQQRVSRFMVMLATLAVLLSRYTAQPDAIILTPAANRPHDLLEGLIGFFANLLPFRIQVQPLQPFGELLKRVRSVTLDGFEHGGIPFERILDRVRRRRRGDAPACQVLFAVQNAPWTSVALPGIDVEPIVTNSPKAPFDLEIYAVENGDVLTVLWIYNRDLFDAWRIEQMAAHYERLLTTLTANPASAVAYASLLSASEREQLLGMWNVNR
jgi:hypothetical protein